MYILTKITNSNLTHVSVYLSKEEVERELFRLKTELIQSYEHYNSEYEVTESTDHFSVQEIGKTYDNGCVDENILGDYECLNITKKNLTI